MSGIYSKFVYFADRATWTERLRDECFLVGLLVLPLPFVIQNPITKH